MRFIIIPIALALIIAQVQGLARIAPEIQRFLKNGQDGGARNIKITFDSENQISNIADEINSQEYDTQAEKTEALVNALQEHQEETQESLAGILEQESVPYETFWIDNTAFVKNADQDLINRISNAEGVESVEEEVVYTLSPITWLNNTETRQNQNENWGVKKIQADKAWAEGVRGRGVRVGVIDSGVRMTHEALRGSYVGASELGWYDPYYKTKNPTDSGDHGTHCTGIIAGRTIGVAPDAKWMACRGCGMDSCESSKMHACAQFMLCPTDYKGENKDCSKAPHVVSNSWGGGTRGNDFDNIIKNWIAAGIVPVFANGNEGPNCETTGYPGTHKDVISGGSTDRNDALSNFSSKGPSSMGGHIKPDVAAPGSSIRSSINDNDRAYRDASGTSMSAPHVSGQIALMLQTRPKATVENIKNGLRNSSLKQGLRQTGRNCGNIRENQFPNNAFGHGRIDALAAIRWMRNNVSE